MFWRLDKIVKIERFPYQRKFVDDIKIILPRMDFSGLENDLYELYRKLNKKRAYTNNHVTFQIFGRNSKEESVLEEASFTFSDGNIYIGNGVRDF